MAKLFDNDKGTIKSSFDDMESMPSFSVWANVQRRLSVLNAQRRKAWQKRLAFGVLLPVAFGLAVLWVVLWPKTPGNYTPRKSGFAYALSSNQVATLSVEWDIPPVSGASKAAQLSGQENTFSPDADRAKVQNSGEEFTAKASAEASFDNGTYSERTTARMPLLSLNNSLLSVQETRFSRERIAARSRKGLYMAHSGIATLLTPKLDTRKWRLVARVGLDGSQSSSRSEWVNQNSTADYLISNSNEKTWSFSPYRNHLPIAVFLGAERRLTHRISANFGLDLRHMEGIAESSAYKDFYVVKEGSQQHVGLDLGLAYTVLTGKRLTGFVSLGMNLYKPINLQETWYHYQGETLLRTSEHQAERMGPGTQLNLLSAVGVDYSLTPRTDLSLRWEGTVPLTNYTSPLNVYNNGDRLIHGLRVGLARSL